MFTPVFYETLKTARQSVHMITENMGRRYAKVWEKIRVWVFYKKTAARKVRPR